MKPIGLALLALVVAPPAAAQGMSLGDQLRLEDLRARQEAAERRAIDQANQLMALEARLQAERSVVDLRAQSDPPRLPATPYAPRQGDHPSATATYPSIPDATLADSNRRVRAAAGERR